MADRFFIGQYSSGLVKDRKPFLLPNEAFSELRNLYVWRDRVRKRFGSRVMNTAVDESVQQLYSRFRLTLGNTDGGGDFTGSIPAGVTPAIGQLFSVGNNIYTVVALGNPANMLIDGNATVATFDTTTGAVVIDGTLDPATPVYFFPALPVMGLPNRVSVTINDEELVGFDTRFAYTFNSGTQWEQIPGVTFTGTDSDFFWAANYRGPDDSQMVMFIGNYTVGDPMYYYDGTSFTAFTPVYNSATGDRILNARFGIAFQNRLVLLGPIQEVTAVPTYYRNRVVWSQIGNPVAGNAWYQPPNWGLGGQLDAPTSEEIVSAGILKDRLIVMFERSTWELVYTGNQVQPFVWQTINIELGAESTFSLVPFDKAFLYTGDVSFNSCNGANVERFDLNIPDEVFQISNDNNAVDRVYGVRDYNIEMAYWAFPDITSVAQTVYPSKVLVYNYRNGSWSVNDDSITCFGQFNIQQSFTWNSTQFTWAETDAEWNDGVEQRLARNVIAGNQQGFTFIVDHNLPINAYALSITNITESGLIGTVTCINHNLNSGEYVMLNNITATADPFHTITGLNGQIFETLVNDANSFLILLTVPFAVGAAYSGGGTIRRVSTISAVTKQYNFYLEQGISFQTNKIDFLVDKTPAGEVTINVYPGTADLIVNTNTLSTSMYPNNFYPLENYQESLWHTVYPQVYGTFLQFQITMNNNELLDPNIADSDFVLNAMVIYATPTASRLQ